MRVRHLTTDRSHGDLAVGGDPAVLDARRRAIVDRPWTWLDLVHGGDVVTVTRPGEHAGARVDAAVTAHPGAAVAVTTADCAPVVLIAPGAVGVAHAGWRGLVAGVVGATAAAMTDLGHPPARAVIGPCIRPDSYEFGADDLDRVAARWGDGVRTVTADGRPALDLPAGVRLALAEAGIDDIDDAGECTATGDERWWSHRARADRGRMATVAWLEPDEP